jgi:hypothetical protein
MPRESVEAMLSAAYSAIRGNEMNKSVAGLTLDHFLQARIDSIKTQKLPALDAIEKNINDIVAAENQG